MKATFLHLFCLSLFGLFQGAFAGWDQQVYSTSTQALVKWEEMVQITKTHRVVVLGEKHFTPRVQELQAQIISDTLAHSKRPSFVAWEFLNFKDSDINERLYRMFFRESITAEEMLQSIFRTADYSAYAPILNAAKKGRSGLVSVNLSREEKKPVVQAGISAADPNLVPIGYEKGSPGYFERFEVAMGGHSNAQTLSNYFDAQCLTDDVMAAHIQELPKKAQKFLVTGSFHSDYNDGVVARISKRLPGVSILTIRLIDASDFESEVELQAQLPSLLVDPKYGPIADFVVFANEPAAK